MEKVVLLVTSNGLLRKLTPAYVSSGAATKFNILFAWIFIVLLAFICFISWALEVRILSKF